MFHKTIFFFFFNKTELVLRPAEGGCIWIAELVRMEHLNYLFFWFRSFQWIENWQVNNNIWTKGLADGIKGSLKVILTLFDVNWYWIVISF